MKTLLGFAASFSLAAAAPASEQGSFDLACSGTMTTKSLNLNDSKPYEKRYRVELASRKWCEGSCDMIRDIADVQPAFLVLRKVERTVPGGVSHFEQVDRRSGKHEITSTTGERARDILLLQWEGVCEKKPFSGFPRFDTKF